jgi:VanZ family protein
MRFGISKDHDAFEPTQVRQAMLTMDKDELLVGPGLSKVFRIAAWSCVVLLAVLSWLPAEDMVRTTLNGRIEHFTAYMGTMLLVGAAHAHRLGLSRLIAILITYAGVLELGQNLSPGWHSSVFDFAASLFGVVAGAIAFQLVQALLRDAAIERD